MNKILFILLFIGLPTLEVNAQNYNFVRSPGNYIYKSGAWGLNLLPIIDDTIFVGIESFNSNTLPIYSSVVLQKLIGNQIVFEKEFKDPPKDLGFSTGKTIRISDSNFINICPYTWYSGINLDTPHNGFKLIAINPKSNFDTIFIKDYISDSLYISEVFINGVLFQNSLYLCGVKGNIINGKTNDILIGKYTLNGNKIWHKTFGTINKQDIGLQITTAGNNKMLISARTGETLNGLGETIDYQNSIYLVDTAGNIVFNKKMWKNTKSRISNIHNSNDGYFYYGNAQDTMIEADDKLETGTIAKIDSVGNILWQKYFNEIPNTSKNIYNFEALPNSDVIITGSIGYDNEGWACLMDKNGNVRWQHSYKSYDANIFNVIAASMQAANGDFIFAGTARDSATNKQGAWLLRVDSNGCLIPSQCAPLAVIQTDLGIGLDITVYPNPGNDVLNISTNNGSALHGSILLYNVNGKIVIQQNTNHLQIAKLYVNHLPKGIYVLRYFDEVIKKWWWKKVVIGE